MSIALIEPHPLLRVPSPALVEVWRFDPTSAPSVSIAARHARRGLRDRRSERA